MDIKFDMERLMQQMKDYAVLGFLISQVPKEKDRELIQKTMEIFMEYQIPVDTAFEIIVKVSNLLVKPEEKD